MYEGAEPVSLTEPTRATSGSPGGAGGETLVSVLFCFLEEMEDLGMFVFPLRCSCGCCGTEGPPPAGGEAAAVVGQ